MSKRKIYSAIDAAAMVRRRKAFLPVSRQELCDYVTDFAYEFYQVAGNNDMKFLTYLLAMVIEESVHQSDLASGQEAPSEKLSAGD